MVANGKCIVLPAGRSGQVAYGHDALTTAPLLHFQAAIAGCQQAAYGVCDSGRPGMFRDVTHEIRYAVPCAVKGVGLQRVEFPPGNCRSGQ